MTNTTDLSMLPSTTLRRKKIWSINRDYLCSVIGTCVRRTELQKLATKKQFRLDPDSSDYQLHSGLISRVGARSSASRTLTKMLDKKFRLSVNRYKKIKNDQDVRTFWDEDIQLGNVPGAYWAIVTHPGVSEMVTGEIYGEIHMMGHDSHGDYQRDQRAFTDLREKIAIQEEILGSERCHYLKEKNEMEEQIAILKAVKLEHGDLKKENVKLKSEIEKLKSRNSGSHLATMVNNLERQAGKLQQHNDKLRNRIEELTIDWADKTDMLELASDTINNLEEINTRVQTEKKDLEHEMVSLETAMLFKMATTCSCDSCEDLNTDRCSGPDLCGKTVLYVGGLHKMVPHYKKLIEKHGGSFLHHDGGKEASITILPKLLDSADAVLCPVDCVSHNACTTVKKVCKRYQKPFVMMRSSGLSSLAKGLEDIVQ